MRVVQVWIFQGASFPTGQFRTAFNSMFNETTKAYVATTGAGNAGVWDVDASNAGAKLNPGRLKQQMFAYTVTNQIVNTFLEIGLPYVLRQVDVWKVKFSKKKDGGSSLTAGTPAGKGKKKVVFEDEKEKGGMEERLFLESVRSEVALPEYDLFADYNEMVMQFGYVVLWSTIWPLAPGNFVYITVLLWLITFRLTSNGSSKQLL